MIHTFENLENITQTSDIKKFYNSLGDIKLLYSKKIYHNKENNFYYGGNFQFLEKNIQKIFFDDNAYGDIFFSKYHDATLLDDSIVLDKYNNISHDCILNNRFFHQRMVKMNKDGISKVLKKPQKYINLDKQCVFMPANGLMHAYTHWFTEIMPRVIVGLQHPNFEQLTFIFSDQIRNYQKEMLYKLGISDDQILLRNKNDSYKIKELYLSKSLACVLINKSCIDIYKNIEKNINHNNIRSIYKKNHQKIYITRKDDQWKRALLNLKQIQPLFDDKGYMPIIPEDLNLDEKIYLFSNATYIVGEAGGGMTNIVFCKPKTNILILSSENFPSPIFSNLCSLLDVNYGYVIGSCYDSYNVHNNNANFTISLEEVLKGLNAMEAY